jgi:predicted NUDIX family phosphoesterase
MATPTMKDYGDEEVLGLPTEVAHDIFADYIAKYGLTAFWQTTPDETSLFLSELTGAAGFLLRNDAEQNFTVKQIIPYCLVVYSGKDGDLILHYSRAKENTPEARLAGKRSIGVGGHINPEEGTGFDGGDSYIRSLHRELNEEFGITKGMIQDTFTIGFVNDEENEVGQVHIGVVHVIVLNTTDLGEVEKHLTDPRWDTPQEIFLEKDLETWSEMVLKGLREKIEVDPWHLSQTGGD